MSYAQQTSTSRMFFGAAAVLAIHVGMILALKGGLMARTEIFEPPPPPLTKVDVQIDKPPPTESHPGTPTMDKFVIDETTKPPVIDVTIDEYTPVVDEP